MEDREPTAREQYLMTIGGFDTLSEMIEWMNSEKDDDLLFELEEPNWEEIALREIGCYDSGSDSDNDPDELAALKNQADIWLEEKARRDAIKRAP